MKSLQSIFFYVCDTKTEKHARIDMNRSFHLFFLPGLNPVQIKHSHKVLEANLRHVGIHLS